MSGDDVAGTVLVLLAAVVNACSTVLQRRAARDEPDDAAFSIGMLFDLVKRPSWIGGILCMILGFLLQAAALTVGRIAVVQPLLTAELPLTLLLAAWVFSHPLPAREWVAIGAMAVGLAGFVYCLAPSGGDVLGAPTYRSVIALVIGLGVVAGLTAVGASRHGQQRAAALGLATGTLFGIVAALVAAVGAAWAGGFVGLFTAWQTYAVIVLGPTSFFLLQSALQAGELDASQPGFTLMNPLVGVLWGVFVFGEVPRGGAWVVGEIASAAVIVGATLLLVRSPALRAGEQPAEASPARSG
ncbi:DMT family transporter [Actinomycetospora sp. TBRC 11914]|uniref:DMT family transporter n=1 Tax=Actinomycetospora sp. TBRC 11914 TaxID=2729387 RepID=UPI00145DBDAC|nr:DMT family transporter [Actinomycetospora sp. TBRC 11914]NMO90707.1 DMT family transporter [Actinomycetospora sp. TBRC 11914]